MKLNKKLSNLLDLNTSETRLMSLKIFPLRSLFINHSIERHAKYFIITNERVFIISRGWIIKGVYSLNELTEVKISMKWIFSGELPAISIKTKSDLLDIFFYSIFPCRKKIDSVVKCIKKCNPEIEVKKYLKEDQSIRDIMSTKIEFK